MLYGVQGVDRPTRTEPKPSRTHLELVGSGVASTHKFLAATLDLSTASSSEQSVQFVGTVALKMSALQTPHLTAKPAREDELRPVRRV